MRIPLSSMLLVLGLYSAAGNAVPLAFTNTGLDGQTTVFRASLGGLGLGQIGSLAIEDSNSGTGGSPGVFSGFDLDFVFIDIDGDYATAADRVFGSTFIFTTGAIRPTADPAFAPTLARPGPTFGSAAADTVDPALSTLGTRDGFFPSPFDTSNVFGWLTLGDGGLLQVGFAAPVVLTGTEALFIGEVGTTTGELATALVTVSSTGIPEPATAALLALGLTVLVRGPGRRRPVAARMPGAAA